MLKQYNHEQIRLYMGLREIGEFGFIERIRHGCVLRPERVVKSIGDDAAAVRCVEGELLLVTTDLLVERVHFIWPAVTGFDLGRKSMAVNLSDIAAMGGTARDAYIGLAIPERMSLDYLDEFYRGIRDLTERYGVNVLGGDTTRSENDLIVSICVTGNVPETQMLCRNTARAGDIVCVTGLPGESRAGLQLVLNGVDADLKRWPSLHRAHVRPEPHLKEGRFLAGETIVHAAIDVSDGLCADIAHIASQSRLGVRLFADKIPLSEGLKSFCAHFDFEALQFALAGGEDYVLLCTVDPAGVKDLTKRFEQTFSRRLYAVGEMAPPGKMALVYPDGRSLPLPADGWDHFKSHDIS